MAKRRSWFTLVKRFFRLEKRTKPEKEGRRKWVFERLQVKRLPPIAVPPPPKTVDDAEEQVQSKHALSMALAVAAASEAAAAAASEAAAKVAKLTSQPQHSSHQCQKEVDGPSIAIIHQDTTHISRQKERKSQELAAIRIQAAFRGYLARKALRALKGIVRLQAIIRGRAVRRQAMTILKHLQSIVDIHSQVCATRSHIVQMHCDENCQIKHIRYKVDKNSQRRWDDSLLSKKDAEALFLSKKEAALKRERIKGYSFNHRKSAESEHGKPSGRWRYWLEQWVDTQLAKSKEFEDLEPVLTSHLKPKDEDKRQFKQKNSPKKQQFEPLDSPQSAPRRYLRHKKQCSMGDDNFQSSPAIPTYMATTESAKAKARSLSSPKLRPGAFDVYSDSYSPYKNKLSLVSSMASEVPSFYRSGKPNGYQQKSPSLKGIPATVKPSRNIAGELSID
ncbi:protein IQ-DOMAIN 11 [Rhodamnia argentea]|uniref:Protein IQ-DOMAIN 11 n=1 Tax=Rhodamnia argentea TaxID=178133 RepID=A0A8B8QYP2_9MYRT|nr:protein IQ-DOMAIN 11 [Rhodamnia argentea]XP_030552202.2 protein IQ-DOMAIN 11 [Rhodamnia argentea]XP_030552203.2 protein IQ-DOMAIN 11 [Rhodamnia argentea]XP_030552205.2 protein IQ-DOMAIN 11 [Rhodamnia argentea]XP_048140518.1 protein IQ-DOMAIN 11 [Rhodamnia argentea]